MVLAVSQGKGVSGPRGSNLGPPRSLQPPCQPGTGTVCPCGGTSEDGYLGMNGEGHLNLALQGLLHDWLARARGDILGRVVQLFLSLFLEHL